MCDTFLKITYLLTIPVLFFIGWVRLISWKTLDYPVSMITQLAEEDNLVSVKSWAEIYVNIRTSLKITQVILSAVCFLSLLMLILSPPPFIDDLFALNLLIADWCMVKRAVRNQNDISWLSWCALDILSLDKALRLSKRIQEEKGPRCAFTYRAD